MSRKTALTAAITGTRMTPGISPYLPVTPAEIAPPDTARRIPGLG